MADFSTLIATLQATIKTNYNQEITGQILQDDLLAIVDAVNRLKQDTLEGYAFYGAPLADGASVAVTQNTFFLVGKGTYTINGTTETTGEGIYVLVYDSVNDEIRNYALFVYDTEPTEDSENAITSGAVFAALAPLATKEDVEAVEQQVAQIAGEAGLAEAVIDTDNAGTEQEFTFRKSGGDGGAYYRKIKGKSVVVNQLIVTQSGANEYADTRDNENALVVIMADSTPLAAQMVTTAQKVAQVVTIPAGTGSFIFKRNGQLADFIFIPNNATLLSKIAGHKVFVSVNITAVDYTTVGGYTWDDIELIDLTLAGLADEISTPADFEALYPGYHEYNPGTLISNDAEAVETTGVNQWDEETEVTGSQLQSKNLIPVFPNTAYYITMLSYPSHYHNKIFYNAEGEEIGLDSSDAQSFTTPADCAYMRFVLNSGYGTTYNNDICINLSNPAINGQYFPYWKRTLQLGLTTRKDTDGNVPFADGMKGAGTAADWADKVGGEKRMGRVDLGTLEYSYSSGRFDAAVSGLAGSSNDSAEGLVCALYVPAIGGADKTIFKYGTLSPRIYIYDSAYTDPAAFKAAMNGVMLDFELATPVPFTWAEPLNLGVKVDENGTERAVAPEGATAPSAPFVADTTYTMSVARIVEKLQNL